MTDEPENLILKHLCAIRAEIQQSREETNLKIGTLAESMASMRKDISNLESRVDGLWKGFISLENNVQGLRADIRMITLAVDAHTQRLDKVEDRLEKIEARLPVLQ